MKRIPLERGKPLARGTKPLKRTAKLRARRVPKAFAKRRDPKYAEWVRARSCMIRGAVSPYGRPHVCQGAVQVCHVKSRGSGGDDHANVVPMCWRAHLQQGLMGVASFSEFWHVDLKARAAQLWAQYQRETGAP